MDRKDDWSTTILVCRPSVLRNDLWVWAYMYPGIEICYFIKSMSCFLRIDYCGFGPFCSTRTKLLLSISLLKVYICIIY